MQPVRQIPEGQRTKTIYSLIRDKKYTEVLFPHPSFFIYFLSRLSSFWIIIFNSLPRVVPFPYSDTATTKSKISVKLPACNPLTIFPF